jgi:hypothetical protein
MTIGALVEEAVREYIVTASISDLDGSEVAETQTALLDELREIPGWTGLPCGASKIEELDQALKTTLGIQ